MATNNNTELKVIQLYILLSFQLYCFLHNKYSMLEVHHENSILVQQTSYICSNVFNSLAKVVIKR